MRSRYPQSLAMFAVLLATLATSALAQSTASATTARIQQLSYQFEEAGRDMEYQLYVPTTYDAATASPLIVLLHGLGSNAGSSGIRDSRTSPRSGATSWSRRWDTTHGGGTGAEARGEAVTEATPRTTRTTSVSSAKWTL